MDDLLLRHATPAQLKRWGQKSQQVQMINRIMQEPPQYRPSNDFVGYIFVGSFQCGQPVEHQFQFYDTGGRYDSLSAVIDGVKQDKSAGWYHWGEIMAAKMPRRIISEL